MESSGQEKPDNVASFERVAFADHELRPIFGPLPRPTPNEARWVDGRLPRLGISINRCSTKLEKLNSRQLKLTIVEGILRLRIPSLVPSEARREAAPMRPASAFSGQVPLDTFVYVDGFNLYYGAVKGTAHKWLNIRQLCELLLPRHNIERVKYFTARVSARPGDPDQPIRQQTFLRALATLKDFDIILGHFLTKETYMPLAGSAAGTALKYVRVLRH